MWPKVSQSHFFLHSVLFKGFLGGAVVKNPPANSGDLELIPGSGRSPGEGNGDPLQYSCLENPMDAGAWWITVHGGHKESDTTEHACTYFSKPGCSAFFLILQLFSVLPKFPFLHNGGQRGRGLGGNLAGC